MIGGHHGRSRAPVCPNSWTSRYQPAARRVRRGPSSTQDGWVIVMYSRVTSRLVPLFALAAVLSAVPPLVSPHPLPPGPPASLAQPLPPGRRRLALCLAPHVSPPPPPRLSAVGCAVIVVRPALA